MNIEILKLNPIGVNTYIVWDDTLEAAIIDPGCYFPEEEKALENFVADNNLKVKHILNTHLHLDHTFGNRFVEDKYGLRAEGSSKDNYWLENNSEKARRFGIPIHKAPRLIDEKNELREGDVVRFGNIAFKCIEVPGHSPGGLVFYEEKQKVAFVGDVLFYESIGRADLLGGNFDELISNIKNKIFTLAGETIIYPGHGSSTTVDNEMKNNPFFK